MKIETRRRFRFWLPVVLMMLAGCQTYEPAPLDPETIVAEIDASRRSVPEGEVVTLGRATELMRAQNPRVLEARAAYLASQALAETPTPLPNPTLEAGPLLFDGKDILGSARYGAEAALGWTIFLDGRRGITDERNELLARAALVAVVGTEREEYLSLRRELVGLAMASRMVRAREELASATESSALTVRRLIDAAQATALDLSQVRLEAIDAESETLASRVEEAEARSLLAERTGVWARAFRSGDLPPLPPALPTDDELRAVLLRDHAGLASMRAEYLVAEKELHLEIARQYPELEVTLTFEREPEADVWGLPLGIQIPLFDRNQQGIAVARGHRAEVRTRYMAGVSRSLAEIDAARARVVTRRERLDVLKDRAEPAAKEALDLARRALGAGATDALQFLAVLRSRHEIRVKTIEAEQELYEAWFDLEEACGAPLLAFPEEVRKETP